MMFVIGCIIVNYLRIAPSGEVIKILAKGTWFLSYLSIENPSKRPRARPQRKSKSHTFQAVEMRSKTFMSQLETVLLIASYWLDAIN